MRMEKGTKIFHLCFILFYGLHLVDWTYSADVFLAEEQSESDILNVPSSLFSPRVNNISKVNYIVDLSVGQAVLDSELTFKVRLWIKPQKKLPDAKFLYTWLNTADRHFELSENGFTTQSQKIFPSNIVKPGQYLMTVVVSPSNKTTEILTYQSIPFTLTETLNGHVTVQQELKYQRSSHIFATNKMITFHVNVTDHFSDSHLPAYIYSWYNGSQLLNVTKVSNLTAIFTESALLSLTAKTLAEFSSFFPETLFRHWQSRKQKMGIFNQVLYLKEPLSGCNWSWLNDVVLDQSVVLGNPVVFNVTCFGSMPTALCWNITQRNSSSSSSCNPSKFMNTTTHLASVVVSEVGWHEIHFAIYNDVSFLTMSQSFYVYNPGSTNTHLLMLPIVFSLLGIVLIFVGIAYISHLRRTNHIEVADFDFYHPTSGTSPPYRIISKLSEVAGSLYLGIQNHFRALFQQPANYRKLNRSHSFYDSL